ncbi:hypothetical protein [Bosea sp. TAF32]|uniref:hypothetical protein n=1 Tax=Bosea sp. TAF32 TaxID=3237482 RepID=UPI003F910C7D
MPEASACGWIAKVGRSWRNWRDRAPAIVNQLDEKPAFSFLLHLRAFISLVREIISR